MTETCCKNNINFLNIKYLINSSLVPDTTSTPALLRRAVLHSLSESERTAFTIERKATTSNKYPPTA